MERMFFVFILLLDAVGILCVVFLWAFDFLKTFLSRSRKVIIESPCLTCQHFGGVVSLGDCCDCDCNPPLII